MDGDSTEAGPKTSEALRYGNVVRRMEERGVEFRLRYFTAWEVDALFVETVTAARLQKVIEST